MKNIIEGIMIALLLVTMDPFGVSAAETSVTTYNVRLTKWLSTEFSRNYDPDKKGNRSFPLQFDCTISKNSGTVIFNCPDEIIAYEIWDLEGDICLFITDEEKYFVNELFSLSVSCQIRLTAGEYTYVGYIR